VNKSTGEFEGGIVNHFIEFETTVVSNFLGRGDPCTRGWERERNVADDVSLSGFSRRDSYLGAGVTCPGRCGTMDGFRCD